MRLLKKEVRAWLKSKPKKAVVGFKGSPGECPLASFMKETYHLAGVRVGTVTYRDVFAGTQRNLPVWGCRFVNCVDRTPTPANTTVITAAQALEALDKK